jgi:anti-sigma-K factor RskA
MSHDEWLERADLYVLGALDGEELTRFENHIDSGCDECDRQLHETREAILQIPLSLPRLAPSPDVKRRVMAQIRPEASDRRARSARPRRGFDWARVALAASFAGLIGLAALAGWDDWTQRGYVRDLGDEAGQLRTQLVQRKDLIRYLEDPEVSVVLLAGVPPSRGASGRVLWRAADRSGYVLARGLPQAPSGNKYALWAVAETSSDLAGLFTDQEIHRAFFRLPPNSAPSARPLREFVVTLEPAAAGPKPTGSMHLRGSVADNGREFDYERGWRVADTRLRVSDQAALLNAQQVSFRFR